MPEEHAKTYLYWKRVLDIVSSKVTHLNFYGIPCYDSSKFQTCPSQDAEYFKKDSVVFYFGDEGMNRIIPYEKAFAVFKPYVLENHKIKNLIPIPLGFFRDFTDVPYIPIEKREIDIFFSGQKFSCDGKTVGLPNRDELKLALNKLNITGLNVQSQFTDYFARGFDQKEYTKLLMNSKIALCPYGTNKETFRFMEAMKFGCIIASCELPHHWFYDNSPHIKLNNWFEINKVIEVLNNKNVLNDLHKSHLNWWNIALSESAMSEFIIKEIKKLN